MVPDWRPSKILSKPHVVFDIWCKTSGDMSLASWKVINLFFIFNHRSLREGGGVSPSTEPLQTLHGTFLQVYKIENKVYCCNYNFKSEMPTLIFMSVCSLLLAKSENQKIEINLKEKSDKILIALPNNSWETQPWHNFAYWKTSLCYKAISKELHVFVFFILSIFMQTQDLLN